MPTTYKFTYFDGRGRGELCRFLFSVSGTKYEDVRIPIPPCPEWLELKPNTPLGSLPVLEIKETGQKSPIIMVQSQTIARYLANKFGYAGKTPIDQAIADAIVATTDDFRVDLMPALFQLRKDPPEKEKWNDVKENKAPKKLQYLENILTKNGDYFVGKSLTWADFAVWDILATAVTADPTFLSSYPKLKAHSERMPKDKKMTEYLKCRGSSPF